MLTSSEEDEEEQNEKGKSDSIENDPSAFAKILNKFCQFINFYT